MAAGRYSRPVNDGSDRTAREAAVMRLLQIAATLAFLSTSPAMAQERIRISSEWGKVSAELADNDATRARPDTAGHDRDERSPAPGEDRQSAVAAAGGSAAAGLRGGVPGALGTGSSRDLLSQRPCPPARDRDPRQRERRRFDLRSP